jgi:hypothetical protein
VLLPRQQAKLARGAKDKEHLATSVNAVNLEDRFGDVETDCRHRLHGSLL